MSCRSTGRSITRVLGEIKATPALHPTGEASVPHIDNIALVSLTDDVPARDVMQVAAAVQKQVTRDFAPAWDLSATVNPFADLLTVPADYLVVVVFGDPDELAGRLEVSVGTEHAASLIELFRTQQLSGIHLNAFTRQPFALVEAGDGWEVAASHEILELIADPYGNRLIAAAHPLDPAARVLYVVEVCDPCQALWYPVNGIRVSDFYTPRYFDPVRTESTRYSFTGEIAYPLQVLDGGYITWIDPVDSCLRQLQAGIPEPIVLATISDLARSSLPLRTVIDGDPRTPRHFGDRPAGAAASAPGVYGGAEDAARATAIATQEALISLATHRG
jgi:hypothetical protein